MDIQTSYAVGVRAATIRETLMGRLKKQTNDPALMGGKEKL